MKDAIKYIFKNIAEHPVQSVVSFFTAIGVIFTIVSNTRIDIYITSHQIQANADAIKSISSVVSSDHNSIIILQQIAKDNVAAQDKFGTELQQLNSNFVQYLETKH